MTDDDDDEDFLLFDEPDDNTSADPSQAWASSLIVGEPLARAEDLTLLEAQYRAGLICGAPVLFTADDELTGEEILENQDTFARRMGRPGTPVSYPEALAWIDANTEPVTGRWLGG
jgi:hypothetical protein